MAIDEQLVRHLREQTRAAASRTDSDVVEEALAVHLGLHALDEARAQGTLAPDRADRLAVDELRVIRRRRFDAT